MNENIEEKNEMKFSIECIGEEVKFLDTKVNVGNISKEGEEKQFPQFLLVSNMYSKDRDTHQNHVIQIILQKTFQQWCTNVEQTAQVNLKMIAYLKKH